jgi:hypothetical protein
VTGLPPIHGRRVTVERPQEPARPRTVPLAGLASLVCVVVGLALIVVGVWTGAGWPWGLVALGAAMLAVERWPSDAKGAPRP